VGTVPDYPGNKVVKTWY